MQDKPSDAAIQRACDLANAEADYSYVVACPTVNLGPFGTALAKEIQRASDIAKLVCRIVQGRSDMDQAIRDTLNELILPDPEADLLKQANKLADSTNFASDREWIIARDAAFAALKSVKEAG